MLLSTLIGMCSYQVLGWSTVVGPLMVIAISAFFPLDPNKIPINEFAIARSNDDIEPGATLPLISCCSACVTVLCDLCSMPLCHCFSVPLYVSCLSVSLCSVPLCHCFLCRCMPCLCLTVIRPVFSLIATFPKAVPARFKETFAGAAMVTSRIGYKTTMHMASRIRSPLLCLHKMASPSPREVAVWRCPQKVRATASTTHLVQATAQSRILYRIPCLRCSQR